MTDEQLNQLCKSIGKFTSWSKVYPALLQVCAELAAEIPPGPIETRRTMLAGGLIALDRAFGWDHESLTQTQEENIYLMLAQLYIR